MIFAPTIIYIFSGPGYRDAVFILRLLSPLLISIPLISIYSSYFIAKSKPRIVSILLIISTLISIILNYIFIKLSSTELEMVIGVCIATLISSLVYLIGLYIAKKMKI